MSHPRYHVVKQTNNSAIINVNISHSMPFQASTHFSVNTQSMRTMELVRELFNELTLVHVNEPIPMVENQSKAKQVKVAMEGLLKVLFWRLEEQVSPIEFR